MTTTFGNTAFESILSKRANIETFRCVRISLDNDKVPMTISSAHNTWNHALHVSCPHGGIRFDVACNWEQQCRTANIAAENINEEVQACRRMKARRIELSSTYLSADCGKLTLQSSSSPLDIHSLNGTKNGIGLRCPKGGIVLHSGTGGVHVGTTGDIELNLETSDSAIYLCRRGTRRHTIHLGNERSETIVYNRLVVRGELVLADDAVVEKNVSTTRIVDNVVRLTSQDSPVGYDFAVVAQYRKSLASGIVFDAEKHHFYLASHLGEYRQHRFAPPIAYADLLLNALKTQKKVTTPFLEAQCIQCKSVRAGNHLTVQAHTVQCSHVLAATMMNANVVSAKNLEATSAKVGNAITESVVAQSVRTDALSIGTSQLDVVLQYTIGPNSHFLTLQEAMDYYDSLETPATGAPSLHFVFESNSVHNVTTAVRCSSVLLDARHTVLLGSIELSHECDRFELVDARVEGLAILTHEEHRREHAATRHVFRNVRGDARDWSFDVVEGVLDLAYCDLDFINPVIGTLQRVETRYSTLRGTPWLMLSDVREVCEHHVAAAGGSTASTESTPSSEHCAC